MNYSVGILDYGIGGIALAKMIKNSMPDLPIFYFSDSGTIPYGKLSEEDLKQRVSSVLSYMFKEGCDQVVVACHSASSVLDENVPKVTSIIPSSLESVRGLNIKSIGIIGGKRTIESNLYKVKLEEYGLLVKQEIAQPLSILIEAGIVKGSELQSTVKAILDPLKDLDAILLACTHYPAALAAFENYLSSKCQIIDPLKFLFDKIAITLKPFSGKDRFVTTGDIRKMKYASINAFDFELSEVSGLNI